MSTSTLSLQITDTGSKLPDYVDIEKWAEQGYHWKGEFNLSEYSRLTEVVQKKADSQGTLTFDISYESGVYWFSFSVEVIAEVQCQRCLQNMDLLIRKQSSIAILDTQEQASQLEEESDWVLIEDVAERVGREIRLPILEVIEDELLLEVPQAPKHEVNDPDCVPVDFIEDDETDLAEKKENPFAMLADLKGKL